MVTLELKGEFLGSDLTDAMILLGRCAEQLGFAIGVEVTQRTGL